MSKSLHGISAGNTQQYVTNKTRIVAFGCSFTQGVGLDHRTTHMTHYGEYSLKAWPNLTARLLSDDQYAVPCVNHGDGGASSCDVLDHILEEEILPDDIVVIMWPSPHRSSYMPGKTAGAYETWSPGSAPDNKHESRYWTMYWSELRSDKTFERNLYTANSYLKPRCKAVLHIPGPWFGNDDFSFENYCYDWETYDYILDPFVHLDKAPHDDHYGLQSHTHMAKALHDLLCYG